MTGRRKFLKTISSIGAAGMMGTPATTKLFSQHSQQNAGIRISRVITDFEREPLIRPFGFKGGYMSEIWQSATQLESDAGKRKIGLCTQSVLWSDSKIFSEYSESGGNSLMYYLSDRAGKMMQGQSYHDPTQLIDELLTELYNYAQKISGKKDLRKTFVLNALVGLDNAMWLLYADHNDLKTFDEMIPAEYRSALSYRHKQVASIPLMAYSIPINEIEKAAEEGYFFMKIKIGQPGTQSEMLEKDKERMTNIHETLKKYPTDHTSNGRIPYYFDANGRYETKETLLKLLDHADHIGALDQIVLIEEPFPESSEIFVDDLGIRIAADESAHTDQDALKRIEMGYQAIALKAIAKTLSMTLKIAKVADDKKVPCFCADLTVNPILVEWNKNVAARLKPFPGIGMGLLETNGHQNYKNWEQMVSYHPFPEAEWRKTRQGVFQLNDDFYTKSGGIFSDSEHYLNMFTHF